MSNHTISDFVAKLNVARRTRLKTIMVFPFSVVLQLLQIFETLGIIRGYHIIEQGYAEVMLKYNRSKPAFTNIIVVSTPGRRSYVTILELYKLKDRYPSEIFVVSTTKGLKLDIDCLKEQLGGEVILRISV